MNWNYWLGLVYLTTVDCLANTGVDQESCVISSDLEDQCGFVCYPIVKPLLQYLEMCQQKDLQMNQLEEKVREQRFEIIKCESETEALSKQLENNFCSLNSVLKQALHDVENVQSKFSDELKYFQSDPRQMDAVDGVDGVNENEKIKELKLQLAGKESVISDVNLKLIQKYEILEQKDKSMREKDKLLAEKDEYIRQLLEKYFPRSCDIFSGSDVVRAIHVPGAEPFSVLCSSEIPGSGWTIVLRELEGAASLDQKLAHYKEKGFGDLHDSFFIGRKNLYLMTQAMPHEVHIEFKFKDGSIDNYDGDKVEMGDERENYVIKSFERISRMGKLSIQQSATTASLKALFRNTFLPFDNIPDWKELTIMIRETL